MVNDYIQYYQPIHSFYTEATEDRTVVDGITGDVMLCDMMEQRGTQNSGPANTYKSPGSPRGRAYDLSVAVAIRDRTHKHKKHLFAIKLLEPVENDFFIRVG